MAAQDQPRQRPSLALVGEDGNAFAIMGRAIRALRRAGMADQVEAYQREATAGDYQHLLAVTMEWFDIDADITESEQRALDGNR